jgi:hypothetical protein
MKIKWTPHGKIEWCWLQRGPCAIMLQEPANQNHSPWKPQGKLGEGVSICFICEDALALYHEFLATGVQPSKPFVGNGMWVTSIKDPDGYRLDFESQTDVQEETEYQV